MEASLEKKGPGGQPDSTPTIGQDPPPNKKKAKSKKEILFSNCGRYRNQNYRFTAESASQAEIALRMSSLKMSLWGL